MSLPVTQRSNQIWRTLIVEDEVHARAYLRELLAGEPGMSIIGEADDGAEGAELVRALSPDLVFLDIQMPELDAFEMIARVGADRMPAFIFVTAFSEYAVRAFEVDALDYLCKPFDSERLRGSLQRFFRYASRKTGFDSDQQSSDRKSWRQRLAIKQDSGVRFVPVEEVLWIEAANKYIVIRTPDHSYISRQTIQSVVDELNPEQFVRTNRSIVVRKNAIREVKPLFHGDHAVVLTDGTELALSRNYRETFFREMAH
jgi:two-component system LytT family response regulator